MRSKIMVFMLIALTAAILISCAKESSVQPKEEATKYASVLDSQDREITAQQVGQGHGDVVKIFMSKLFNEELHNNPAAKAKFLANEGIDKATLKRVFIESANEYLADNGKNVRMTDNDFNVIINNVPHVKSAAEVKAYLVSQNKAGLLSDRGLKACFDEVDQISQVTGFPVKFPESLLAPPIPYGPDGEYSAQVFSAIALNSAQTWTELLDDDDWITDPELSHWWNHLRDTDKGRALGIIISDAAGGLLFSILSGNPLVGILAGALASICFWDWAYMGFPW